MPALLRAMVRKRVQKTRVYPVMMDWSGEAVKAFTYVPGETSVFVLGGDGGTLRRFNGEAKDRAIQDLFGVIGQALAGPELQTPAK